MALPIGLIVPVGIFAIIAVVLVLGARGRGKPIKCPECGNIFKRPAFAEKRMGVGIGLGPLGDYTCPKCGYKASTSSFSSVDKGPD